MFSNTPGSSSASGLGCASTAVRLALALVTCYTCTAVLPQRLL